MIYEIQKNVPMPRETGAVCKYPFRQMEVGDVFFVDYAEREKARNRAGKYGRDNGKRFAARTIREGDSLRIGIWRIA